LLRYERAESGKYIIEHLFSFVKAGLPVWDGERLLDGGRDKVEDGRLTDDIRLKR
jgi:hypothetical protein